MNVGDAYPIRMPLVHWIQRSVLVHLNVTRTGCCLARVALPERHHRHCCGVQGLVQRRPPRELVSVAQELTFCCKKEKKTKENKTKQNKRRKEKKHNSDNTTNIRTN
jgi:hypothetical protein